MNSKLRLDRYVTFGGVAALALVIACSNKSSDTTDAGYSCASTGGAVQGPQDNHCDEPDGGSAVQPTSQSACYIDAAAGGDDGGGGGDDGGGGGDDGGQTADAGNCGDNDYGATMDNQSGSDDDCKYDVKWTSTPICENEPVYFTVTATNRTDNSPVTGANVRPDVVLDCSHPISNNPADPSPENPPGTYTVGPIVFDKPGRWVVRFHFFENCYDIADNSPHGHAAFYVQVP